MYNFLLKHGQKIFFGLGVLVIIAMWLGISSGVEEFNSVQEAVNSNPSEKFKLYETTMFDTGLRLTIWLLILAIVALVLFGLYHVATNFKSSRKGLIYFAILAVIAIIAYNSVDVDNISPTIKYAMSKFAKDNGPITPSNYRVIVGGITTALALLVANAGAFALGEIRNFFK